MMYPYLVIRIQLPDYLWGIETFPSDALLAFFSGFQTTYEELKQGRYVLPGIGYAALPDYLWGIETCNKQLTYYNSLASRLPMRNWNPEECSGRVQECGASRLPMRNWNKTYVTTQKFTNKLPDYLWGIETIVQRAPSPYSSASRLPMRNWNRRPPKPSWLPGCSLPDYLWGIETAFRDRRPAWLWWASRLPMRNWNICVFVASSTVAVKLPDYLWGIETFLREEFLFGFLLLPDYLWGIETALCRS